MEEWLFLEGKVVFPTTSIIVTAKFWPPATGFSITTSRLLRLYPVFHVLQLKSAPPIGFRCQQLPAILTKGWELPGFLEDVLAIRKLLNGHNEVPIKWANLPDNANSWKDFYLIQTTFSEFQLEE